MWQNSQIKKKMHYLFKNIPFIKWELNGSVLRNLPAKHIWKRIISSFPKKLKNTRFCHNTEEPTALQSRYNSYCSSNIHSETTHNHNMENVGCTTAHCKHAVSVLRKLWHTYLLFHHYSWLVWCVLCDVRS